MSTAKTRRRATDPETFTVRRSGEDKTAEVSLNEGLEMVASKKARWEPSLPEQLGPDAGPDAPPPAT